MNFPYFLQYALRTPWAMEPSAMRAYALMLAQVYAQRAGISAAVEPVAPAAAGPTRSANANGGGVAVVPVWGPIVQRAAELGPCDSGTGAVEIGRALDALAADSSVSKILMQFSTPGGSVFGISELGAKIRDIAKRKKVVGIADSQSASAGYWLMSQCSECYATPGGMVGSIGVYTAHQDLSAALEQEGIKTTLISAGKYKVEGNPFQPLSAEALADTQGQVDAYYRMFTSAVAKGRGVPVEQVRGGMGEGRVLMAEEALKANMIDGIATFDEVVRMLQAPSDARRRQARAAAMDAEIRGLA